MSADARALMAYEANKKSALIAYLLWFFLGWFGAHRFYTERTGSGIAQLILTIVGILLAFVAVGVLILIPVGIWVIIDAFLIPGWVRQKNNLLAAQLGA